MTDFLLTWGTLIIASLALAQPWLIALWKRIYRPGIVDIHETGSVEVGYSEWGPTIGLQGTLRGVHRDLFIRSIELVVTRSKDQSRHKFDWGVFRPERLQLGTDKPISLELPSGFLLPTGQPHRYSILFFDPPTQDEMRDVLTPFRDAWTEAHQQAWNTTLHTLSALPAEKQAAAVTRVQDMIDALYKDFAKTKPHVDAYSALDRIFYWNPGEYSLQMHVHTARPDHTFSKSWSFVLSKHQSTFVRLNCLLVLRATCGRLTGDFNFAYAKYESRE